MVLLTPGVIFLSRGFIKLLVPFGFVLAAKYILHDHFDIFIPTWVVITGTALGLPTLVALWIIYSDYAQHRRAASLGARITPRAEGKWPGNLDVLVNMVKAIRNGYPGDGQIDWIEQCGNTINLRMLWEDTIFTVEPDNIKTILSTGFPNYPKGPKFMYSMDSVLGTGVFNADGDLWKFHRSMTRPFFSRDRISDFDNFERHGSEAIKLMKERFKEGYSIDFQDIIGRFTLDSASEYLFGLSINSLSETLPYPHNAVEAGSAGVSSAERFAKAFSDAQFIIAERLRMGWVWPLLEIFHDRTAEPMKVVDAFFNPIMEDAIRKYRAQPSSEIKKEDVGEEDTLLEYLVKQTQDRTVLKDEILNIMVAGRDTTASTLTFIMHLLAIHPNVLSRLREEIIAIVGPTARPTYDNVRDMKYMRAVINETLRLFPAVPFDARETAQETTWPSPDPSDKPLYIPAKTGVLYSALMMQRREDLWGPDAMEFDPDRFLDDRVRKYLTRNPFIFVPFNAGPRICLGQQFAYNEMSFMLIRLLQNFSSITLDAEAQLPETRPPASWSSFPGRKGYEKFWPKSHLTMYAHGGMWIKMGEAPVV